MAKRNLEVKGIVAKPGTKVTGYVEVGQYHDGSKVHIPVILINGSGEGPTLLINAALHGDEITTVKAATTLAKELDPKALSGNLVILPICNVPAFMSRQRTSQFDLPDFHSIDINRIFPGQKDGLLTYRIAHVLLEIAKVADYHLDLHGSPKEGIIFPFCNVHGTDDDPVGEKMLPLAKAFGTNFIYTYSKQSDELEAKVSADVLPPYMAGGFTKYTVLNCNARSWSYECGEGNRICDEYMDVSVRGLYNTLKFLKMLKGEPEGIPKKQYVFNRKFRVRTNNGGLMTLKVEPGQFVKKGTLIAEITDVFGNTVEEVTMPEDGTIYRARTCGTVSSGDHLICGVTTI